MQLSVGTIDGEMSRPISLRGTAKNVAPGNYTIQVQAQPQSNSVIQVSNTWTSSIGRVFTHAIPVTCFGKSAADPDVCQRRGSCIAKDTCSCNSPYAGTTCERSQCDAMSMEYKQWVLSSNVSAPASSIMSIVPGPFMTMNTYVIGYSNTNCL